jgi:hypothetical protein
MSAGARIFLILVISWGAFLLEERSDPARITVEYVHDRLSM